MNLGHPITDPGDGRQECQTCGKFVWPAIHSCKRIPVTDAARQRAGYCLTAPILVAGYDLHEDDVIYLDCPACGFSKKLGNNVAGHTVDTARAEHAGLRS